MEVAKANAERLDPAFWQHVIHNLLLTPCAHTLCPPQYPWSPCEPTMASKSARMPVSVSPFITWCRVPPEATAMGSPLALPSYTIRITGSIRVACAHMVSPGMEDVVGTRGSVKVVHG